MDTNHEKATLFSGGQPEPPATSCTLKVDALTALDQIDRVKKRFEEIKEKKFVIPEHETRAFILQCETTISRLVGEESLYARELKELRKTHANVLNSSHELFYQVLENLRSDIENGHASPGAVNEGRQTEVEAGKKRGLDEESARVGFEAAREAFSKLPKSSKKAVLLEALVTWNNAARNYFNICIDCFLDKSNATKYSNNAAYAADWLKNVADHYESVFEAAEKLGQKRKDFEPGLLKFKELQQLVGKNEPEAAMHLRDRFVRAGLPTYGFDSHPGDEVPKRIWIPAICFTSALLLTLIALLFKKDEMSDFQRDLANRLFALFAGFAASFVGGTALFTLEIPKNKVGRLFFSATAGIAVIAFVWVYAPYWFKPPANPLTAAPALLGDGLVLGQGGATAGAPAPGAAQSLPAPRIFSLWEDGQNEPTAGDQIMNPIPKAPVKVRVDVSDKREGVLDLYVDQKRVDSQAFTGTSVVFTLSYLNRGKHSFAAKYRKEGLPDSVLSAAVEIEVTFPRPPTLVAVYDRTSEPSQPSTSPIPIKTPFFTLSVTGTLKDDVIAALANNEEIGRAIATGSPFSFATNKDLAEGRYIVSAKIIRGGDASLPASGKLIHYAPAP